MKGLLIAAVICLGTGLWLIFAFCHGNVGASYASPLSASKLDVSITTTGLPAVIGIPALVLGTVLLVIAFFGAIAGLFRRERAPVVERVPERRDLPFQG